MWQQKQDAEAPPARGWYKHQVGRALKYFCGILNIVSWTGACLWLMDYFCYWLFFVWVAVYANYNTIFSNPNTICWEWVDGCWLVKLNSSTITYVLLTCPKVTFERVCFNLPKEVFCFVLFLARIHVFVLFLAKIHVARLAQEYISHIFITQLYEQPLVAALYCIISILEHSTMHIYLLCVK